MGYVKRVIERLPKLSAEEVKRVLKDVSKENLMLDSIIESLSTGLVIVDRQWRIIQRNKAANRFLFNSSNEEQKNDSEEIWNMIFEKEIAQWLKEAAASLKTNIREDFSTTNSDGSVRFLAVSIISLVQECEICGYIIHVEDVTQQKTKDVLVRRMENMTGLTNLAAGMAHEIKNPLGAISIHIQLVQKAIQKKRDGDGLLPDRKFLEDHLDIVNEEINKLNDLVMDFLFAVRPVNASFTLSDPDLILQNIADFFTPEFNRSHVEVSLKLKCEKNRLLIDDKLFRQVVVNIAQNAFAAIKVKYPECNEDNSNQEMIGKIVISTIIKDDKFILSISDNGTGMDRETLSRIFEPYYTTKANGTGLGMTMAYKIIKEFNGDIEVKSELGKGSVFFITLPVPQKETKLLG